MIAVHNMLIVGEPTNGPYIATRFVESFEKFKYDTYNADIPEDSNTRKIIDFTINNGLDIRKFQQHVIETFNMFASAMFDDDLVEELIAEREHPDMHDVIEIVSEFNSNNPGYLVQSLVPIDLKGTFGFVVKAAPNEHS